MRIGPYEVLGELGRGGMGVVYRARRTDLGREYALKVMLPGRDTDPEALRRFRREAQSAARLAGAPGIVGVHDIGEAPAADGSGAPTVYFAMDLVEGSSLERLIERGELDHRRSATLVAESARAVHHAHGLGILHRDLKPANVLVAADGTARVTDFGLAKAQAAGPEATRLTKSGQVLGTPAYMPPEQARGDPLDVRADVYALGATLYECLTGVPPFAGETLYQVLGRVLRDDPAPLRQRDARIPVELETICLKCLEKDPVRRYATAEALEADLQRWLRGEGIAARRPSITYRVRRFTVRHRGIVVTAVVALAGAGVAAWSVVLPRLRAAGAVAEAAREARARREAAAPHLARGREALARLDRLRATSDWTLDEVEKLDTEARAGLAAALREEPRSVDAMLEQARRCTALDAWRDSLVWLDKAVVADPADPSARLARAIQRLERYTDERTDTENTPETPAQRTMREQAAADLAAIPGDQLRGAGDFADALLQLAQGERATAAERLHRIALARVADASAWWWAGVAWFLVPKHGDAVTAFGEALRFRPKDHRARRLRAQSCYLIGDLAGARQECDIYLAAEPETPSMFGLRAATRSASGDLDGALADYGEAIRLSAAPARFLNNRGVVHENRKDFAAALADYLEAARLVPDDPNYRRNVGDARVGLGDTAGALAEFDAVVRMAPAWPQGYLSRAAARGTAGDAAGVESDFAEALRLGAADASVWNGRGAYREGAGDFAGALADYTEATRLDPAKALYRRNLGDARRGLGDAAGSEADYTEAMRIGDDSAGIWSLRAQARALQGRDAEAVADYDESLRRDARSAAVWNRRGDARDRVGDRAGALADYTEALDRDPDVSEFWNDRGVVREARRDFAGALADYTEAITRQAANALYWRNRGDARVGAGEPRAALADYDEALRLAPDSRDARYLRAIARQAAGDREGAIADLVQALDGAPAEWSVRGSAETALAALRTGGG